jgi:lysozyme
MISRRLAQNSAFSSELSSQPYIPSIISDVVIDLSHWQAPVNFAQAKAAGTAAVILKATQGPNWVDATFASRLAAATAAGLLVGAYHFLDSTEPALQIQNFLLAAGGCPVLALVAEPNEIGSTVTTAQTAEAAARLHMATGRAPLIYVSRYGPDERGTGFPNSVLSRCPLWLPAYSLRPVCPPGWSKWLFWQYTDGTVGPEVMPIAGIGKCDRSRFAGTVAELAAWWNGAATGS